MGKFDNTKDRDIETKYDLFAKPKKAKWYLKPIIALLCASVWLSPRHKVKKVRMEGIKRPYILLCNHNAFLDFKVATKAMFPHTANYIVAIDGFIKREGLLRNVGCICKRKFTNDTSLVKNILFTLRTLKRTVVIYPEARYSLVGTTSMLPDSLGKLMKLAKVPVVTLICNGNHIDSPFWNLHHRKNRTEATMTCIVNQQEIETLSPEEINTRIRTSFEYDDYKWQVDNKIKTTYKYRAEGLHKVLYKCPHCGQEFQMSSALNMLKCDACGATYELNEYNELHNINGETIFKHIPDWYEWERNCVHQEIEKGTYHVEDDVLVDSLPNAKGFINLGKGHLIHDINGFKLKYVEEGQKKELDKAPLSMFGCHIEYDYNDKGDNIELSTLKDTFYLYFEHLKNIVTKIHFATEEMFKINNSKIKQ